MADSNSKQQEQNARRTHHELSVVRSTSSTMTMAERFPPSNTSRKSNFDSGYFSQYSPKDPEWWNLRRRLGHLRSVLRRKDSTSEQGKAAPAPDRMTIRAALKEDVKKWGRMLNDIWFFGPFSGTYSSVGAAGPREHIYSCLREIDVGFDDELKATLAWRLMYALPRMMEARMFIQYNTPDLWNPERPSKQSRPASDSEPSSESSTTGSSTTGSSSIEPSTTEPSATESSTTAATETKKGPPSPVPEFPYKNNRPEPNQGVERLMTEYHEESMREVYAVHRSRTAPKAGYRAPPIKSQMEEAAAALGISVIDVMAELEFYSNCLAGRNMNQIGGVALVKPEGFPAAWRRTWRRDVELLEGRRRGPRRIAQKLNTDDHLAPAEERVDRGFDEQRKKLIMKLMAREEKRLNEWERENGDA